MDGKLNELFDNLRTAESSLFAYVTRQVTLGKIDRRRLKEILDLNRGFRQLMAQIEQDMKKP